MPSTTAVVIVNWNGCEDTLSCLASLVGSLSVQDQVVICDNASSDNSINFIKDWATFSRNPSWVEHDRDTAIHGGAPGDPTLVLVNTGGNLGFAGGNNVGIRYALARGHDFVWLLNGDTIVNSTSLSSLRERMEEDSSIGMCGSTLVYYNEPNVVQALGGARFDTAKGIGEHIGLGLKLNSLPERHVIEPALDYVVGASMMVSRKFLERVGPMCEDYFLYFEEIDWAMRSKGLFKLAWARESVVLHKEGGSIGSSHRSRPSDVSLSFMYRSRLLFARNHTPDQFWSVFRRVAFEAIVYAKRLDFTATLIVLRRLLEQFVPGRTAAK